MGMRHSGAIALDTVVRQRRGQISSYLDDEVALMSIERGDYIFDMGTGSLQYKKYFFERTCDVVTYDHFRPLAPKAQVIALKNQLSSWWSSTSNALPTS